MSTTYAYYWPFQAPGWLGRAPEEWDPRVVISLQGKPVPDSWRSEVFAETLSAGIRIAPEHWGLVKFDFSGWAPGVRADDSEDRIPDFEESVELVSRRLRVMNTQLLMAEVASLELERSHLDTTRLSHNDTVDVSDRGMGGAGLLRRRLPLTVELSDFARHFVISEQVLRRSVELLDQALQYDDTLELFDLLHLGRSMFQMHEYAQALTSAWTISEKLLNKAWATHLMNLNRDLTLPDGTKAKRLNRDRRDTLTKAPQYPMSVKLQFLELSDQLSFERFLALTRIRGSRNRWLHDLDRPDAASATEALRVASELLSEDSGLPLRLGFARSIGAV